MSRPGWRFWPAQTAAGQSTATDKPPCTAERNNDTVALCAAAMRRTINQPRPLPVWPLNTSVHLGQARCQPPEQFKAWSQNLGHEGVLTTFYSYGTVAPRRQGEIIKNLTDVAPAVLGNEQEQAMRMFRALRSAGFTPA